MSNATQFTANATRYFGAVGVPRGFATTEIQVGALMMPRAGSVVSHSMGLRSYFETSVNNGSTSLQVKIRKNGADWLSFTQIPSWEQNSPGWASANSYVRSMCVMGSYLYAGSYNSTPGAASISRYDGTSWSALSPGWSSSNTIALSMAVFNGKLYVGTNHTSAQGEVWEFDGTSTWTKISVTAWASTQRSINCMAVLGTKLYVGTTSTSGAAQVWSYPGTGTTWTNVSHGAWSTNNLEWLSMCVIGTKLYAGSANSSSGAEVWSYPGTGSTWTNLSLGSAADTKALCMTTYSYGGNKLYVGTFNATAAKVWTYNTDSPGWAALSPTWPGGVTSAFTMALLGSKLFIGCSDGNAWCYDISNNNWGDHNLTWAAANAQARCMAVFSSKLYVGSYNNAGAAQVWYNKNVAGTTWTEIFTQSRGTYTFAAGDVLTGSITTSDWGGTSSPTLTLCAIPSVLLEVQYNT
jgi:hypothetical protein